MSGTICYLCLGSLKFRQPKKTQNNSGVQKSAETKPWLRVFRFMPFPMPFVLLAVGFALRVHQRVAVDAIPCASRSPIPFKSGTFYLAGRNFLLCVDREKLECFENGTSVRSPVGLLNSFVLARAVAKMDLSESRLAAACGGVPTWKSVQILGLTG